jgi:hypothetical protein
VIQIVLHVQAHGDHNVVRLVRQGKRRTVSLLCKVLPSGTEHDIMLTHWVDTATQMAKDIIKKSNVKWQFKEINDFNN